MQGEMLAIDAGHRGPKSDEKLHDGMSTVWRRVCLLVVVSWAWFPERVRGLSDS